MTHFQSIPTALLWASEKRSLDCLFNIKKHFPVQDNEHEKRDMQREICPFPIIYYTEKSKLVYEDTVSKCYWKLSVICPAEKNMLLT